MRKPTVSQKDTQIFALKTDLQWNNTHSCVLERQLRRGKFYTVLYHIYLDSSLELIPILNNLFFWLLAQYNDTVFTHYNTVILELLELKLEDTWANRRALDCVAHDPSQGGFHLWEFISKRRASVKYLKIKTFFDIVSIWADTATCDCIWEKWSYYIFLSIEKLNIWNGMAW